MSLSHRQAMSMSETRQGGNDELVEDIRRGVSRLKDVSFKLIFNYILIFTTYPKSLKQRN